ncbi:MAG TPA: pseudouridine-5'-phosphate glycosidase, partial [Thermoanaerobaculia bacterium]|nr:pseudouridine-5'-phosphate glycosidase [Thermoanaerobaculia bacterium]
MVETGAERERAGRGAVVLSEEVHAALAEGRGVVALESTILCHGLPFPKSLETHRVAEAAVRREGAVPALVAVVDGAARAGLDEAATEALARAG